MNGITLDQMYVTCEHSLNICKFEIIYIVRSEVIDKWKLPAQCKIDENSVCGEMKRGKKK